jgi:hypothetical protein
MSEPESNWRPYWEQIEQIFDAAVPVQDPALFATRPGKYNKKILRLQEKLHRTRRAETSEGQYARYLVAGTIGNGKTSELFHLGSRLTDARMVVFLDLWRHFEQTVREPDAMERLEPWELLGLLGLAIYRASVDHFGHRWDDEPELFGRALEALRGEEAEGVAFDVSKLARGMVVAAGGVAGAALAGPLVSVTTAKLGAAATDAGLTLVKAASDAMQWTWRLGRAERKQPGDSEPEVQDLVAAVNRMIMALQSAYARPLLLVVDGLDRIRTDERARTLLVSSSLLGKLLCDEVVTGPEFMFHGLSQNIRDFSVVELCNVPVLEREQPTQHGPGMVFFHELVDKRVAAVARLARPAGDLIPNEPFPAAVIDRLAYYSGGVIRDFMRMTHATAGEAWEANAPSVTLAMVDVVLEEFRDWKQARLNKGEIAVMREVMDDPEHGLPNDELAIKLLRELRLLPYPNETPWYYPHPLLTMSLLTSKRGSAS